MSISERQHHGSDMDRLTSCTPVLSLVLSHLTLHDKLSALTVVSHDFNRICLLPMSFDGDTVTLQPNIATRIISSRERPPWLKRIRRIRFIPAPINYRDEEDVDGADVSIEAVNRTRATFIRYAMATAMTQLTQLTVTTEDQIYDDAPNDLSYWHRIIQHMPQLRTLVYDALFIDDFQPLTIMVNAAQDTLQTLAIQNVCLDDRSYYNKNLNISIILFLTNLPQLKKLNILHLHGNWKNYINLFTNAFLENKLNNLNTIILQDISTQNNNNNNNNLLFLRSIHTLTALSLGLNQNTRIILNKNDLLILSSLSNLQRLSFGNLVLSSLDVINMFHRLSVNLKHLYIQEYIDTIDLYNNNNNNITQFWIQLIQCKNLRSLILHRHLLIPLRIVLDKLMLINNISLLWPSLHTLDICDEIITDEHISIISQKLPQLVTLVIAGPLLTELSLFHITQLKNLISLTRHGISNNIIFSNHYQTDIHEWRRIQNNAINIHLLLYKIDEFFFHQLRYFNWLSSSWNILWFQHVARPLLKKAPLIHYQVSVINLHRNGFSNSVTSSSATAVDDTTSTSIVECAHALLSTFGSQIHSPIFIELSALTIKRQLIRHFIQIICTDHDKSDDEYEISNLLDDLNDWRDAYRPPCRTALVIPECVSELMPILVSALPKGQRNRGHSQTNTHSQHKDKKQAKHALAASKDVSTADKSLKDKKKKKKERKLIMTKT